MPVNLDYSESSLSTSEPNIALPYARSRSSLVLCFLGSELNNFISSLVTVFPNFFVFEFFKIELPIKLVGGVVKVAFTPLKGAVFTDWLDLDRSFGEVSVPR